MKCCKFTALALMSLLITLASTEAAAVCGLIPIGEAAASLRPCFAATRNPRGNVPPLCCTSVAALLRYKHCLCAAMLSPLTKNAGINLEIAIAIPKRCNIRNRQAGRRCGRYTVP